MISIAIDGPSASGKSTIAKVASKKLGYTYVDTGALYRTIALAAVENNIDVSDENKIKKLLTQINIDIRFENFEQRVILNNRDVSEDIRLPEISLATSKVSALKVVRDYLFSLQRNFAEKTNVIMDGRDIGTVILPNATVKIFLSASVESRAKRRYKELQEKGIQENFNSVLDDMKLRDYQDSHREIAPLKKADDAIMLDSSNLTLEETVQSVLNIITERVG